MWILKKENVSEINYLMSSENSSRSGYDACGSLCLEFLLPEIFRVQPPPLWHQHWWSGSSHECFTTASRIPTNLQIPMYMWWPGGQSWCSHLTNRDCMLEMLTSENVPLRELTSHSSFIKFYFTEAQHQCMNSVSAHNVAPGIKQRLDKPPGPNHRQGQTGQESREHVPCGKLLYGASKKCYTAAETVNCPPISVLPLFLNDDNPQI